MIDYLRCINQIVRGNNMNDTVENQISEEDYIDEDYEEIANSENETNLINKINTPINIILIVLIIIVLISIILCAIML